MSQTTPSSAMTLFQFESHDVRTLTHDDGSIHFVLADVCKVFGLSNPSEVKARLKDGEYSTLRISEGSNINDLLTIINEQGLYRVIFRSTKPEASRFQDWVFGEVLPQIRKTGKYEAPAAQPAPPAIPERTVEQNIAFLRQVWEFSEEIAPCTERERLLFKSHLARLMEQSALLSIPKALPAPEMASVSDRMLALHVQVPSKTWTAIAQAAGRLCAKEYRKMYGDEPLKIPQYIDGALRRVSDYPQKDWPWVDEVIRATLGEFGVEQEEKA